MTYPGTLLRASNLFAKKELGQNFLADPKVAERIVNLAKISNNDVVLEIGAGLGAITVHAAKQAAKVFAVEKDARLIELLITELNLSGVQNVEVLHQDIFKIDIEDIANKAFGLSCQTDTLVEGKSQNMQYHLESGDKREADKGEGDKREADKGEGDKRKNVGDRQNNSQLNNKLVVIGNLPYNISSQVLFQLVEKRRFISRAVLMFQKELAERLCAKPGGKAYGRLSAVIQYCAKVKNLTDVEARLFFPKPDVESRVIEVNFFVSDFSDRNRKQADLIQEVSDDKAIIPSKSSDNYNLSFEQESFLFKVIKAAFSKRRKTLRNSLTGSELGIDKIYTEKGLELAGIDPERRAETLEIREFVELTMAFWSICGELGIEV